MKIDTFPLAVPEALLGEVRQAAEETGLSLPEAMCQSIKLGLPRLKERLSAGQVKPFTAEERRQAFGPGSADAEFDALAAHCSSLPTPLPEE